MRISFWNRSVPAAQVMVDIPKGIKEFQVLFARDQNLILPYLRIKRLCTPDRQDDVKHIFDALEDLYIRNVTHPILSTNLAILMGEVHTYTLARKPSRAAIDEEFLDELYTYAVKTAHFVARKNIGIEDPGWWIFRRRDLPLRQVIATTVLSMFYNLQDGLNIKKIHDQFAKQYPHS